MAEKIVLYPWHISLIFKRMLTHRVSDLEYNPITQYKFHRFFAWIWVVAMIGVKFLPAFHNNLASLLIMEVSLYANFATDFGAMSAALAAQNQHCKSCTCDRVAVTEAIKKPGLLLPMKSDIIPLMKKLLLVALATVVVLGAGVLAVRHYKNYQNKKTHAAVVAVNQASVQLAQIKAAETNARAEYVVRYNTIQAECQKGIVAYNALTAAVKAKTTLPNCGSALTQ